MSCGCKPQSGPEFDPDFEGPSCEDIERFNSDIATCPSCGEELFHDAAICPSCGSAITTTTSPGLAKPALAAAAIVALAAFVFAFVL